MICYVAVKVFRLTRKAVLIFFAIYRNNNEN